MTEPPKILILEDSIASAMLMQATIERKKPDFEVRVEKSLAAGLKEVETFHPHLIVLDLTLSDAVPAQTLAAIPQLRKAGACVLAVSGDLELESESIRMGANEFMGKAIGEVPTPFMDRITSLLQRCRSNS